MLTGASIRTFARDLPSGEPLRGIDVQEAVSRNLKLFRDGDDRSGSRLGRPAGRGLL
jgi:hypothetical protein